MSHHNSHVGIPNTLLNSFSNSKPLFVTNLIQNKVYESKPNKTGTIKDYYDDSAEELLSKELETSLGVFLKNIKSLDKMYDITNYINENHGVLDKFIKFQLQRSKKSLDTFNNHSLTAKYFGNLTHSDYLRITADVENINMLSLIGGRLFARVCVANENSSFVTNSIGFYFIPNADKKTIKSIIIPYEAKCAIYIEQYVENKASHYYVPDEYIKLLNKHCYYFELNVGNGFIISTNKDLAMAFLKK